MLCERGAQRGDVDSMSPDGLVQQVAGDVELLRPLGDVGGDFRLDLVGVHGDCVAVLGFGVGDGCGGYDVGHAVGPRFGVLLRGMCHSRNKMSVVERFLAIAAKMSR